MTYGPISACRLVPDSVTVTGHGAATGTPDIVVLSIGAEATDESPARALEVASRSMTDMVAAFEQAGVGHADLQTGATSVNQWHERHDEPNPRYRAHQHLTALVRDIGSSGALVTAVIDAGGMAARLHNLRLSVSNVEAMVRSAREAAWRDALARAQQYASLSDRSLGAVRRIVEGSTQGGPRLQALSGGAQLDFGMPMEAGENELTATVEVEWALVD